MLRSMLSADDNGDEFLGLITENMSDIVFQSWTFNLKTPEFSWN